MTDYVLNKKFIKLLLIKAKKATMCNREKLYFVL